MAAPASVSEEPPHRAAWLAAGALWAAAIVWLSLTPAPPDPGIEFGDKLGHLAAYAALMFCWARGGASFRARLGWAAASVAMGIGLEFAQGALGYRSREVGDMLANAAGVALGWALARALARLSHLARRRAPARAP
ncbi:MAG: hypothetical protein AB1773_15835 [Pseudomonadota bacterium]